MAPPIALKTPKGARDNTAEDDAIRAPIFSTMKSIFQSRGGEPLDTPVFELREVLAGKYGEDSKLIYELKDQGGELLCLRYDLTVPFARYLAQNGIREMKRYQLGKVYRRDQPAMTKGRLREFWQCDFDIAGQYDAMIPDAEILRLACQVFDAIGWRGTYTIKINHRKILDGVFAICGVPVEKFRMISSAVDKLDKSPWEEVRREMVEDKGLDGEVADRIGGYVNLKGGADLLEKLQADQALATNETAGAGLADMELLFKYLKIMDVMPVISFDMSLARGLDYYTGVIYEVITEGSAPPTTNGEKGARRGKKEKKDPKGGDLEKDRDDDPNVGVGSVAAGGRYDNLVGMFSQKGQIPCVGISFGVERIVSIMTQRRSAAKKAEPRIDAYILAFPKGLLEERMRIGQILEKAGISTAYMWKDGARHDKQFKEVDRLNIPFSVIIGEGELKEGKVKIKQNGLPEGHPEKEGVEVQEGDLVQEMMKRIEKDPARRLLNELQDLQRKAAGLGTGEQDTINAEIMQKITSWGAETNGVETLPMR